MKHKVIAVVGDGSIGWSTAIKIKLRDPTADVTVYGSANVSASSAAAAMLNVFAEVDENTFKTPSHKTKFELAIQATTFWPHWAQTINDLCARVKIFEINYGTNVLYTEQDCPNFKRIRAALHEYEEPYVETSSAIHIPNEGWVNSEYLLLGLRWAALKIGVKQSDQQVGDIDFENKELIWYGPKMIVDHVKPYDKLVLAAGAWSYRFMRKLPIQKVSYGQGTSFTVTLQDHDVTEVMRTPVRGNACGLVVVPRSPHTLYIGASFQEVNHLGHPYTQPKLSALHTLIGLAADLVDKRILDARLYDMKTSFRPLTADGLPLIGEIAKDAYVITGTKRDGLHMSPLLAEDMACRVLGDGAEYKTITDHFSPLRQSV